MKKVLGTGLAGLVGSRITELLSDTYEFENVSRTTGTDITDKESLLTRFQSSDAPVVLHLAAYTDVEGAEKEKDLKEESAAWKMNVEGTQNVLQACEKNNKKLIHISTDMVFPGDHDLPFKYTEDDATGAVGWYAKTKEEAEKVVSQGRIPWTILRIAYPYRANFEKKEYIRIFKWLLEEKREIKAVTDHYFTPTFIDDLAPVIDTLIQKEFTGKIHAGGEEAVSPFIAATKVAEVFGLNKSLIGETTRAEFFKGRAPRAYNLSLKNDKIEKLGIKMRSLEEGLEAIKQQL